MIIGIFFDPPSRGGSLSGLSGSGICSPGIAGFFAFFSGSDTGLAPENRLPREHFDDKQNTFFHRISKSGNANDLYLLVDIFSSQYCSFSIARTVEWFSAGFFRYRRIRTAGSGDGTDTRTFAVLWPVSLVVIIWLVVFLWTDPRTRYLSCMADSPDASLP